MMEEKQMKKRLDLVKGIIANKVQRTVLLVCLAILLVVITAVGTYAIINHESKTTQLLSLIHI